MEDSIVKMESSIFKQLTAILSFRLQPSFPLQQVKQENPQFAGFNRQPAKVYNTCRPLIKLLHYPCYFFLAFFFFAFFFVAFFFAFFFAII